MEHVTSRQNPLVKRLRDLAAGRRPFGELLLDGVHLLEEALSSDLSIEIVALASDVAHPGITDAAMRAATRGARLITLPPSLMETASPVRQPSGVIAIARMPPADPERVLARTPQLVLLLDAIQDPGNVGAIIRVAEACGATGVLAGPGCADPFGWKALRGGMGSTFRLPVCSITSVETGLQHARLAGARVLATVPRGGTPLPEADLATACVVLLGGEGPGLSAEAVASAGETLTIPMHPPVESLNVATAAALVLYEASRQRQHVALR